MEWTGIPKQAEHQAMPDASQVLFVPGEPGDGAYRARPEYYPVRVPIAAGAQSFAEIGANGDARKVVVAKRRMTSMRVDQHLFFAGTGNQTLRIGQSPIPQRGLDHHLVVL